METLTPDKILIVDDEPEAIENCRRILSRHRYQCVGEADSNRALAVIERERPQVLLTDLRMPGLDGIGLLQAAKRIDPAITVVLLTAYASIQTAVASMRHGAFDYLAKPFTGQELRTVVQRALGQERGVASVRAEVSRAPVTGLMERGTAAQEGVLIGNSAATQMVRDVVERVAATEAALLISGEAGTGKEYLARTIHARCVRRSKPFVSVGCIAGDDATLDAQVFGVAGSSGSQPGLLEMARGGTLYLNEVGGLSPRLQAKIARALKECRGRRVGEERYYDLDLRVMAASTQDLQACCDRREFREDLYWHLNVVPVLLRPLRERVDDIDALAHWILRTCQVGHRDDHLMWQNFTPRARRRLRHYPWPGNLRELWSVIEHAAVLADGSLIDLTHLPDRLRTAR
ncbi:sigma-54-dependent transcriptional regulator [Nitrospira lenta]|uniref:Sigma-54 dependent response regulator n=1 Tax=Nitrospira lenta TaxID=1436998 RepID=A0A330L8M4_9BACT|nr:sigma-54 dependent transcriptional regulator [Nitrospira lenta]SPP66050.1 Sigma-54 dependent response regulator [Nitrospira lenta]